MEADLYWVTHPSLVFAPCKLSDGKAQYAIDEYGESIELSAADVLDMSQVRTEQLQGADDICAMAIVTEGVMLHTIRIRYARQDIYTRVARILIAINPFESLPIYSSQYLQKYSVGTDGVDLPPHIFGIGQDALAGLRNGCKDQAVLISGESGAGKTESAKLVLSYISEAAQQGAGGIENAILQTNPVLEAFGNAMTVRNNNSSRFGKWMDMSFSKALTITGCAIISYLLEVTRVCTQAEGERNFHIFFMILQARSSSEFGLSSLKLQDPIKYKYLQSGKLIAPGVHDGKNFDDLKEALTVLGFSREMQTQIFHIVAGVLVLGNCEFEKRSEDLADLVNEFPAQEAAKHLGIDTEKLKRMMLYRKLFAAGDVTETPLNAEQAERMRDCISRLIYGRLFLGLIERMNAATSGPAKSSKSKELLLGVLDIAGFESFAINSLEQLLINLSNEHLHQQFNHTVFKSELEDYRAEELEISQDIDFVDNADILTFIDGKGGVLDILEEEVALPQTTDLTYVTKVLKNHEKHKRLVSPKFPGEALFGINHYAGEVKYTCDGFLEKNKDNPPEDIVDLMQSSSHEMLKLCGESLASDLRASAVGKAKKVRTWTSGYRASLRSLMGKIRAADPHYIRCVKPNHDKVAGRFTSSMVFDQLLLSGVLEAVKIRQQGYSSRITYTEFVTRYRCVATVFSKQEAQEIFQEQQDTEQDDAIVARKLVQVFLGISRQALSSSDFAYGKTKVFFRHEALQTLESGRMSAIKDISCQFQRIWRAYKACKKLASMKRIQIDLKAWLREITLFGEKSIALKGATPSDKREGVRYTTSDINGSTIAKLGSVEAVIKKLSEVSRILTKAELAGIRNALVNEALCMRARMQQEVSCNQELEDLRASMDPIAIEKTIARAKSMGFPSSEIIQHLEKRAEKLSDQLPLVRAVKLALSADPKDLDQVRNTLTSVEKVGLDKSPEEWLPELDGAKLFSELQKFVPPPQKLAPPPTDAGKKRVTITGFDEHEQTQLLQDLVQATEEYDIENLQKLLGEAIKNGVPNSDTADARQRLENLQSTPFVLEAMREAEAAVNSSLSQGKAPPPSAVKMLQNLTGQLLQLEKTSARDECNHANRVVQDATRRLTRQFPEEDAGLAASVFSNLATYPELKKKDTWSGHKDSILPAGSQNQTRKDQMLLHCQMNIAEGLTQIPGNLETQAVLNFRNIRMWMHDKPAQDCQRTAARTAIISLAKDELSLRNEIYIQIMKQMTANSSERSVMSGWELFAELCETQPPEPDLAEFVLHFLRGAAPELDIDVDQKKARGRPSVFATGSSSFARRCLLALAPESEDKTSTPSLSQLGPDKSEKSSDSLKPPTASSHSLKPRIVSSDSLKPSTPEPAKAESSLEVAKVEEKVETPKPSPKPPPKQVKLDLKVDDMFKSKPLLKFNNKGNEHAVLAKEGLDAIAALPAECSICPVILIGDGRGGKSYLSSRLLGVPEAFHSDNTAEPVTEGIDIVVAPVEPLLRDASMDADDAGNDYMLLMDCEGGNNALAAIRTLVNVFGIVVGTEVVFVAGGMASEQALQNLGASLAARSLIRLDEYSELPAQKLVFVVNMNTLRYDSNTLEQILATEFAGERAELREFIKGSFPSRTFHAVPLMGSPDFESQVASWRQSVLKNRMPLTLGGAPLGPKQLTVLLDVLVAEVKRTNEVSFPSVQRTIIYDNFLKPLLEELAADAKANFGTLKDYDDNLIARDPRGPTLAKFDEAVAYVKHAMLVAEARKKLEELLNDSWKIIEAQNETFGEQIKEIQAESREKIISTQTTSLAHKGILSRLQVTQHMATVETRSAFVRKRGGEPDYSEWTDTGCTCVKFEEKCLEGIGNLRRIQAHNLKKNPSVWSQIFTLGARKWLDRTCMLTDGHFLWWEPGKENNTSEGGCLNFFVHTADVVVDPATPNIFTIKPALQSGWEEFATVSFTGGKRRTFAFNCEDSAVPANQWIENLREHIAFCQQAREELGQQHFVNTLGVRRYMLSEVSV